MGELFLNSGGLGGGGEIRRNEATTNTNGAAVAGDLAADSVRAPMNIQQDVVLREETTHSHRRSREKHESLHQLRGQQGGAAKAPPCERIERNQFSRRRRWRRRWWRWKQAS